MSPMIDTPRVGLRSESEVLDWAHRVLGPLEGGIDLTSSGSSHQVRRLTTRSGDPIVVKWFQDAPCFFHTIDALSDYAIALGHSAPKLIDQNESLRALVMTASPGDNVSSDAMLDPTLHFTLGTLLRQFHQSAPANRSADVPKQWAAQLSRLLENLEDALDPAVALEARKLALELLDLEQIALTPTHGAIGRDHIITDPDWGVSLVGYSHTQYDPWVCDLASLERDWWTYSPELKNAFFTGYEGELSSEDDILLRAKLLIDALEQWEHATSTRSSRSERSRSRRDVDSALGGTLF